MTSFLLCLDFQKAFDSVWLKGLIVKLHTLKINGSILKLIDSFLFNRKVKLIINKSHGNARPCHEFGVPQGSVLSPLLFIIYISDMFDRKQTSTKCKEHTNVFKYADDGSLAVTHEDPQECYRIAQEMCDHLSEWCRKWKLTINCDRNKTECLIIRPNNSRISYNSQNLKINGQVINFVQHTKVLGVVLDHNLTFDSHANRKVQQCWYEWYKISKSTTRYRGLNISSLVILFKAVVLTKLLYAAPVWMKNNISRYKDFYSRVCLKISGATHFPSQNLALLAMGLEPLSVIYNIIATKFTLKALTSDENMRNMILQIDGSRAHPFYHHIVLVKKYLQQKEHGIPVSRLTGVTTLLQVDDIHIHYQKADINKYKTQMWKDFLTLEADHKLMNHFNILNYTNEQFQPNNHKKLFPRTSKRSTDTKVMDLIHGHSMEFKSFKYTLGHAASPNCDTCLTKDDIYHRLIECTKYNSSYRNFLEDMDVMEAPPCIFLKMILEADSQQIMCFRNMAQIIHSNSNLY